MFKDQRSKARLTDMFPHEKRETQEFGRSPGNGITPIPLSRDPLATEGEATPGPDDYNPYEDREYKAERKQMTMEKNPTKGDDPFVFDDIGDAVGEINLPELGPERPQLPFDL